MPMLVAPAADTANEGQSGFGQKKADETVWKFTKAGEFEYSRLPAIENPAWPEPLLKVIARDSIPITVGGHMRGLKIAVLLTLIVPFGTAFADNTVVKGEVKNIDAAAGKVTLKHGAIKNLNMDAMTMVLRVSDPSMLKNLKVGDKVRFEAERAPEGVTITKMQKSK